MAFGLHNRSSFALENDLYEIVGGGAVSFQMMSKGHENRMATIERSCVEDLA